MNSVNNPLDETQVLIKIFSEKNVRIILRKEVDKYDDVDYVAYFHARDIAKLINYEIHSLGNWKRWKITFYSFDELTSSQNYYPIYLNTKVDKAAQFINEQDIKIVLLKIHSKEAEVYKQWLLEIPIITKKIFKRIVEIKHQQELDQERNEKEQLKKQLESQKLSEKDIMQLSLNAVKIFPKPERVAGAIYIATSPDYQKKYTYKIGLTTIDKKAREQNMQTSNPDINIVFSIDATDVRLTESYIHEYLKHLNYEKEFFYVSSLDKAKEIITFITNFVNECISKYDGDNEILQKQYIDDNIKQPTKMDLTQLQPQIRGRSKSPCKKTLGRSKSPKILWPSVQPCNDVKQPTKQLHISSVNPPILLQITDNTDALSSDDNYMSLNYTIKSKITEFCNIYVTQTNNKADHISRSVIVQQYRNWYSNSYSGCDKPGIVRITKAFIDNFFHCEPVNIPEHKYIGWQQYKLKTDSHLHD